MRSAAQRVGKKSTHVLRGGYAEGLQRRFVSHSRGCLFWELANSRSGLWSWVGAPRIQKRTRSLRGASYVGQLGGVSGFSRKKIAEDEGLRVLRAFGVFCCRLCSRCSVSAVASVSWVPSVSSFVFVSSVCSVDSVDSVASVSSFFFLACRLFLVSEYARSGQRDVLVKLGQTTRLEHSRFRCHFSFLKGRRRYTFCFRFPRSAPMPLVSVARALVGCGELISFSLARMRACGARHAGFASGCRRRRWTSREAYTTLFF